MSLLLMTPPEKERQGSETSAGRGGGRGDGQGQDQEITHSELLDEVHTIEFISLSREILSGLPSLSRVIRDLKLLSPYS